MYCPGLGGAPRAQERQKKQPSRLVATAGRTGTNRPVNQGPGSEAVPWESPSIDFVGTTPLAVATSIFSITERGEPVKPLLHKNPKSVSPRGPVTARQGRGRGPGGFAGPGGHPRGERGPSQARAGEGTQGGGRSLAPEYRSEQKVLYFVDL